MNIFVIHQIGQLACKFWYMKKNNNSVLPPFNNWNGFCIFVTWLCGIRSVKLQIGLFEELFTTFIDNVVQSIYLSKAASAQSLVNLTEIRCSYKTSCSTANDVLVAKLLSFATFKLPPLIIDSAVMFIKYIVTCIIIVSWRVYCICSRANINIVMSIKYFYNVVTWLRL